MMSNHRTVHLQGTVARLADEELAPLAPSDVETSALYVTSAAEKLLGSSLQRSIRVKEPIGAVGQPDSSSEFWSLSLLQGAVNVLLLISP
ncbi:unnamed protein product [Sphagnum balticum]